jgi:hypothetical protein
MPRSLNTNRSSISHKDGTQNSDKLDVGGDIKEIFAYILDILEEIIVMHIHPIQSL